MQKFVLVAQCGFCGKKKEKSKRKCEVQKSVVLDRFWNVLKLVKAYC